MIHNQNVSGRRRTKWMMATIRIRMLHQEKANSRSQPMRVQYSTRFSMETLLLDSSVCTVQGRLRMVKSCVISPSIRLLALDIDDTLLNSQFQISDANLSAL